MTTNSRIGNWLGRFSSWYRGSLLNRAALEGQLLLCGILLALCSMTYLLVSDQVHRSVRERLDATAAVQALRLQAELDRILVEFESLSQRPLLARALVDSREVRGDLRRMLADFRMAQPEVQSLVLVDELGATVASTVPDADQASPGGRAAKAGLSLGLHGAPGRTHLDIAFPVALAAGRGGILLGQVDLAALLGRVAPASRSEDGLSMAVVLEDASGQILQTGEAAIPGEVLQARQGVRGFLAEHGVALTLVVNASKASAYAPLYGLALGMAVVAVLSVVLIMLMIRRMANALIGPLAEMSHRAMEIAGAGPTGLRELPVTRSDEIGWMGTAFNEMVFSLRQSYADQEAQVRARTEEVAEARERLAGVLAGIDDVVYAMSPAFGALEYVSPAVAEVFGYSVGECMADRSVLRAMVLSEDAHILEGARRALAVGFPQDVRYRIRRADGAVRWVQDRFHLVIDERGVPLRVSGLISDVSAAVQAEASLHLRERALASSSCGVVISDMQQPGQPILYVNDAFERITGYAASDVLGRNCSLLQRKDDTLQPALSEVRAAIAAGRECKVVVRNYRKDGQPFWNELQLSPMLDDSGRVTHYIGVQNDISGQIAATRALVESEQRLALTIDALHEGVWDWNIRENSLFTSPSWSGILGLDPVVVGASYEFANFTRQLPSDWAEKVEGSLQSHLAGNSDDFYLEHPMLHADGRHLWVANHGRVVERDADGKPLRMVGTIVDITQRIESSQQIIGLMSQLDSVFTLSPDAFIYFSEQANVSFVNPAFERLTGIQAGEAAGLSRTEIRNRLQGNCDPAHPFPWFDEGVPDELQDGQLMYLLRPARRVLLVSRRGGGGNSMVIYIRDVTRETEVDRMKSEFLTTAAHELRTPMASIMGFAELLMLREFPPERTKDMLGTMHRQARRLTDLINELLDLARIEARAGKDFKMGRHHIEQVVQDAVAAFHVDGDRSRIRLSLADGLPEILIDPAKMQQAVINLLSNAYKYSPRGGPVDIAVMRRDAPSGGQVGVVVRDHGIGMTEEQTARVFERFFRADPSGNIPGTGLGMSLVKEIMDTHGGTVEVDSEIGHGTAVSLWLPIIGPMIEKPSKAEPVSIPHGELTLWLNDSLPPAEGGVSIH